MEGRRKTVSVNQRREAWEVPFCGRSAKAFSSDRNLDTQTVGLIQPGRQTAFWSTGTV